jgi:hypothetical protein
VFWVMNSIITILFIVDIITRFFDKYDSYLYFNLNTIVACVYAMLTIVYFAFGLVLLIRLKQYFALCSRPVLSFVVISTLFIFASLCRAICYLWKPIGNKMINSNTFSTLCYFDSI